MPEGADLVDFGARSQLNRLEAELASLKRGGGGGGTTDGMEARVAKLEAHVENIGTNIADLKTDVREIKSDAKTDFRLLFGAIIAAALGLAGLMAKGFHWL